MKRIKLNPLILATATVLAGNANGAIIAYEGFNPAPSSTNIVGTGTGSGTGFSGNWAAATGTGTITRTNDNTGIVDFPNNVTFTNPAGGTARYTSASFTGTSVTRSLSTTVDLSSTGSFYLSYLYNDFSTSGDRSASVFVGSATQRLYTGLEYGGYLGITRNNASNKPFTSFTQRNLSAGATFNGQTGSAALFIVAEFLTQAVGNDTINLKAYSFTPGTGTVDLSPSSVAWDATQSFNGSGTLDRLGIFLEGADPIDPEIDEIRLGQTWLDVTSVPEPGAALLGSLGLLALLRRRR